jgi:hypothetical protein
MLEDWEKHRREITSLYVDKGKSLSEVLLFMKANYGFDAS